MEVLFPFAAANEAGPLAADPRALCIGVGKAAAACALTEALTLRRADAVVAFGVAGAYPIREAPAIGDLCLVIEDGFADEGVITPDGFRSLGSLGLGDDAWLAADRGLCARVADVLAPLVLASVRGATVSTGSGTDEAAAALAVRTGAAIETMEGAAIALVCARLHIPWVQLRCISNRTGDRDRGGWDLAGSTRALQDAVARLLEAAW